MRATVVIQSAEQDTTGTNSCVPRRRFGGWFPYQSTERIFMSDFPFRDSSMTF
jgi:hypothetical protein